MHSEVEYDGRYDFKSWPKTPRLTNEVMHVTEKVDGSNGCIVILPFDPAYDIFEATANFSLITVDDVDYKVAVQSKGRYLFDEKGRDNFNFARWVDGHKAQLVRALGYGRHYGEWWGSGIQRGYGLVNAERRFSLFDTRRWGEDSEGRANIYTEDGRSKVYGLGVVPELYHGPMNFFDLNQILMDLDMNGSKLIDSRHERAEGVIINLALSKASYKAFVNDDGVPKSLKIIN